MTTNSYPEAPIVRLVFGWARGHETAQCVVTCPLCGRQHTHGLWEGPGHAPMLGVRVKHCATPRRGKPHRPGDTYELTDPLGLCDQLGDGQAR